MHSDDFDDSSTWTVQTLHLKTMLDSIAVAQGLRRQREVGTYEELAQKEAALFDELLRRAERGDDVDLEEHVSRLEKSTATLLSD